MAPALEERPAATEEPSRLVAIALLVQVASSSVVMMEPAVCDVLFLPTFVLTVITGQLMSPTRLPRLFVVGLLMFVLANYASVLATRTYGHTEPLFYMVVTIYLLVYTTYMALFLGKFGGSGMRIVRDGYQIAAVIAAGIGVLASLHVLPNSEIFFRDASMVRVQSTFKDPNVFGPFLIGALLMSLPPLIRSRRFVARHLIVIGLCLTGVTLAGSRGAYVHFVVSIVVYLALEFLIIGNARANRRLVVGMVSVAPVLAVAVLFLLVKTDIGPYLLDRLTLQAYDQQRFSNQWTAFSLAQEYPFGIGPGAYTSPRFLQDVHNLYLKVLVENGVLGLVGLLFMVAASLFYGLAGVFRRGPNAGMQAALVAVLAGIMVESIVISSIHWRHFFLFMGLPIGLTLFERARDEREAANPSFLQSQGTPF
jgi:O-antigen ligase